MLLIEGMRMNEIPVIDAQKCNGCGLCVSVCEGRAFVLVDGVATVMVTEAGCDWCTVCEAVCPTDAISCAFEIVIEEDQSL